MAANFAHDTMIWTKGMTRTQIHSVYMRMSVSELQVSTSTVPFSLAARQSPSSNRRIPGKIHTRTRIPCCVAKHGIEGGEVDVLQAVELGEPEIGVV